MSYFARMLALPVRVYRALLSPLLGPSCRYYPTCSDYALQSLERHGAARGLWLAVKRISRCHPWGGSGLDPVPGSPDWERIKSPEFAEAEFSGEKTAEHHHAH